MTTETRLSTQATVVPPNSLAEEIMETYQYFCKVSGTRDAVFEALRAWTILRAGELHPDTVK
jgi:hypothetical protein